MLRDVVDEEEGVGGEVGGGPQTTVFFLPCGVGEVEAVRRAVYRSRHGVGVFDGRVVAGRSARVSMDDMYSSSRQQSRQVVWARTYSCVH